MPKTMEYFYNAYYRKNGIYYTNIDTLIDYENIEELELLHQALIKLLADGEVLFVINDNVENSESGYILYRLGNWIVNQLVYKDIDTYIFQVSEATFMLPVEKELNYQEKDRLVNCLMNYIEFEHINLDIIGYDFDALKVLKNQKPIKPLKKNIVLILVFFWRYVYIISVLLATFIASLVWEKTATLIIGFAAILYGLYFLLGIKFKFKHVYYIICKATKKSPELDNIRWDKFKKPSLYIYPIYILLAGIIVLLLGLKG